MLVALLAITVAPALFALDAKGTAARAHRRARERAARPVQPRPHGR